MITAGLNRTLLNPVQYIRGGKEYFHLLVKLINGASTSIHLQTYIFKDDETGIAVGKALMRAAKRNVNVYVVADGYASGHLSPEFIRDMRLSGVQLVFFQPFFKTHNFYFGRRLHHKIFVADASHALVGGINIADRYNDINDVPAWLDYAVYTTGNTAAELDERCTAIFREIILKKNNKSKTEKKNTAEYLNGLNSLISIRCNDWVSRRNEISASYVSLLSGARSCITIVCSYFLPGRIIRKLLTHASVKGVKIRLVIAGPSDVMIAKHAERWLYDWLLRNQIEIYEYQPSVLHAKMAFCDDTWMTIGSYNLNNISAYASIELNLDIKDPGLTSDMLQEINHIIETDCVQITARRHTFPDHIFARLVRWLSYRAIRVIFYLFTFYFKQKKSEANE